MAPQHQNQSRLDSPHYPGDPLQPQRKSAHTDTDVTPLRKCSRLRRCQTIQPYFIRHLHPARKTACSVRKRAETKPRTQNEKPLFSTIGKVHSTKPRSWDPATCSPQGALKSNRGPLLLLCPEVGGRWKQSGQGWTWLPQAELTPSLRDATHPFCQG